MQQAINDADDWIETYVKAQLRAAYGVELDWTTAGGGGAAVLQAGRPLGGYHGIPVPTGG